MAYISAGRDPEFPRAAEQLNVRGGQDWLIAADRRYRTSLEGFVDDNKSLIVAGLLGVAALVMIKSGFGKPKRKNAKRRNSSKKFKVVVYGGPGGSFTSYWSTRQAASKRATADRQPREDQDA